MSAEPEETRRLTHEAYSAPEQVLNIPLRLHRKKDGTVFPVEIASRSFPLNGHRVLLVACRDITSRKKAEAEKAELEILSRQLQKSESLNRMAGAIAHNFNNQLQVVIGNLEMAMDDLPQDSNTLWNLTESITAARKASEISGLMLTYRGQIPCKKVPADLTEIIRNRIPLLQSMIPKHVTFKANLSSTVFMISANTSQIQQMIINLVTNAWEAAGDERAAITLNIDTATCNNISGHRFPEDWKPTDQPYVCIELADTAGGISQKDIPNLFDPFFTSKFTGRGLGLSVVLGIARAHDAGITVESKAGQGSIFRVYFPLLPHNLTAELPKPEEHQGNFAKGGMALVVDDEDQVRNMAIIMFKRLGFEVLEARDGVEALEIFKQHLADIRCVLSDLTMPRMNGWETLSAIRKISPYIPVILSSGYDEAQIMEEYHDVMPNAFIGKPYRLKDLDETLRNVLENKNEQTSLDILMREVDSLPTF